MKKKTIVVKKEKELSVFFEHERDNAILRAISSEKVRCIFISLIFFLLLLM